MTTGPAIDVALFMLVCGAALTNLYYLPARLAISRGVAIARLFRLLGWLIISARFGQVLFSTGDILISVPAAVGVFFLAGGEIAAIFNRGKRVEL